MENLPEECLSMVISFTSPRDACRFVVVSEAFRVASDSDFTWEEFLPSDYMEIVSRSISLVEFSSKKELFFKLSTSPLLIDGGTKTVLLERESGKKCYMISARELSIPWSTNCYCWCWKRLPNSRFPIGVELIAVSWLQVKGKFNAQILSSKTNYGIYLVFRVASRAFGLDVLPMVSEVIVGGSKTRATICLGDNKDGDLSLAKDQFPCERDDGWMEVEMGSFYNTGCDLEVEMEFKETEGVHLKAGLVLEGIEIRPKY